jgi:hypothetical protein
VLPEELFTRRAAFVRRRPAGDFLRIATAYDDVAALAALHAHHEPLAAPLGPLEPRTRTSVARHFDASRTCDALHRAIIDAGCRAVTVLLHEVLGRPAGEVNTLALLRRPAAAELRARACWSELYCLTVYRNKVVAHHEVPRMGSTSITADGVRYLVPLPAAFGIDTDDGQTLYEIRDRTGIAATEDNLFELASALFYGVPVSFGAPPTPERRAVDNIAERGGVVSLTVQQIKTALDCILADLPVLYEML